MPNSPATMRFPGEAQTRARTFFDRNWRTWAQELFEYGECAPTLTVSTAPPRERDLASAERVAKARSWVAAWKSVELPCSIEWEQRSWARVGNQTIPVRIHITGADEISCWAQREELWKQAVSRVHDLRAYMNGRLDASASELAQAVRSTIKSWCELDDVDWQRALGVLDWLLEHPGIQAYARQLPIRGIDTKWIEAHEGVVRPVFRALTGQDFAFARPEKLFRCKACDPELYLGGCKEFALSASQLSVLDKCPQAVVICENLVNTLCLDGLEGVLAIHGNGYAVTELATVPWLAATPLLYWGDLDTNGFAILDALRSFAPHARSIMMDVDTLERYRDLCVNEPSPSPATLEHLSVSEQEALVAIRTGDTGMNITTLRLEQERIEWNWAHECIVRACSEL